MVQEYIWFDRNIQIWNKQKFSKWEKKTINVNIINQYD